MTWIDPRVGVKDLRLKLQRKNTEQATRSVRGSASGGARDLREKLSGTLYSRPIESQPPPVRPRPAPESSKPPKSIVMSEDPNPQTKKIASTVSRKKSQHKVRTLGIAFLLIDWFFILTSFVISSIFFIGVIIQSLASLCSFMFTCLCRLRPWIIFFSPWVLINTQSRFRLKKYAVLFLQFSVYKELFSRMFITMCREWQVDMTALVHMGDEDLKALGIPMVSIALLGLLHLMYFSLSTVVFISPAFSVNLCLKGLLFL